MDEQPEPANLEHPDFPSSRPSLLVGRAHEQRLLLAQLEAALMRNGSVVLFSGEAGIGKCRLASFVCQTAIGAGALVLSGSCYDSTETPPYGPWSELLDQYQALRDRSPDEHTHLPPLLAYGSSRASFFEDMRAFIVAISQDRPLVILLEDMHWADTESFDLLRFVARRLTSAPILLLITYRDDEVTREHPLHRLVPILVREALAVRIDVSPLQANDVRALIDHAYRLPGSDADRLVAYLQQRAEGNPFFIGELLRSLEVAVLRPAEGKSWALGALDQARIPILLRQVIDQRLERLGPEVESQLSLAAVIGQLVPFDLWAEVGEVSEPALLLLVERAVAANVLDATSDGTAARFTHALIRDSLYDSVLPPRRRTQHLRIGEALMALTTDPDPDDVAYHLRQAGDPRAVAWLTRAGERAQRGFAWRTAEQRFEMALALLEQDQVAQNQRGWLLFRLALLRRFEQPGAGVVTLEDAERLGRATDDRALVAYARFYQGMLRCQGDDFRLGIAAEKAGIALLDALSPNERARLSAIDTTSDPLDEQNGRGELTLALAENGRLLEARALGEQIIGLPEDRTAGSRGDAFYGLGYTYAALGMPEEASAAFTRAREVFSANDHRSMVTASFFDELMIVTIPYWIDRPHERLRLEAELSKSFASLHEVFDEGSARSARVVSAVLAGRWAEADETLEQSNLRLLRRAIPMLLAPIARHRGNPELAWSLVGEYFPAGPESAPEDSALDAMPLRVLAVELALDEGNLDVARQWLVSLDDWLGWSGSVFGRAGGHLGWAAYYRSAGNGEMARERAQQALARAEAPRQPLALLAANRMIGALDLAEGVLTDAEARLAAAMALAGAIGSQHELALTRLALADLARARGDFPAARAQLDIVRDLCRPMQAALTIARADALEASLPPSATLSVAKLPAGLTAREAEVLRLLATGIANAEIAGQLSLSSRTIDTHLTSIYGKLGVTSRGAAIRFALDHDLS